MKRALMISLLMSTCACSQVSFTPSAPEKATTTTVTECSPNQAKINRPMRVLFIVDQSGSNKNGPYDLPGAATDPAKNFRLNVMNDFFNSNHDKANINWGLSVFNDGSAVNLMKDSGGLEIPFSNTAADFSAAIGRFALRTDVGVTPYKAALALAKQIISNDILSAPEYTGYLVAFLTDGYPTDYCPGGPSEVLCPTTMLENQIDSDVESLINVSPGAIQFSTVYYGHPDSSAGNRLRRMAQIGLGEYVDTNLTSKVNLDDILNVEQMICVEVTK